MLSEISQTEKDKFHMVSLKCGILKKKKVKLIETKNRKVVSRGWQGGGNKEQTFSHKMNKFCEHNILEKAMAPHSSTLTWKIPWTEEPGRLQSMGSRRVEHN